MEHGVPDGSRIRKLEWESRRLREEVERLTSRVERADELERANRELESFNYMVSHDLRAPLKSIQLFGESLLTEYGRSLDAEGMYAVRRILAASRQMSELIEALLKLARLERVPLSAEDFDLSALTERVAGEMARDFPGRAVSIDVAKGLTARADPILTWLLMANLLSNAWKFTAPVANARIEVGRAGEELYVRDNGVGFDPSQADRLFKPFERLHGNASFEGSGIGLATVERIIRRHGGRIRAEGEPGQGATFYFKL